MGILRSATIVISIALTFIGGYLLGDRQVERRLPTPLPRPMISVTPWPVITFLPTWGPNSTPYLVNTPYPPPR